MMKAMVLTHYRKGFITFLFLCVLFLSKTVNAQTIGDYRTRNSGSWSTAGSSGTWDIWNGASWTWAGSIPSSSNNVWIQTGHIVTVPPGTIYNCKNLQVDVGAKLYSNQVASNVYITVWGLTVVCNGEIGNGVIYDALGFNFDGTTTTITGSGTFTANRFRKNTFTNFTTNLVISTNVTLRWDQASNTQLYNASGSATTPGNSRFNVTVTSGFTLNCVGSPANPGNVSIDGVDGVNGFSTSGTITVNGTLNVAGRIYLRTNNTTAGDSCSWIVNNGGILRCGTVYAAASGTAGNFLRIFSGGKLEITGSPGFESSPAFSVGSTLPTTNNGYVFYPGSYCEYSAAGMQYVPSIPNTPLAANAGPASNLNYYGNLKITGSGTKELAQNSATQFPFKVYNDVEISNATGSPVFDCNAWTIDVGGNWINYNQSGFNETNGRVRFYNPGLVTITCPGGEEFDLLTYQKSLSAPVRFNNKVTVEDVLEWSSHGSYDLNGNDLILKNSSPAAIANGGISARYILSERTDNASRVIWRVGTPGSTTTYTIPFGKSSTGYVPFSFTVPAGVNADSVKVATYATPSTNLPWPSTPDAVTNLNGVFNPVPDNRNAVVDRFWQINSTAATPPLLNFTFTYLAAELPVAPYNDPLTIGAQNWNTGTGIWRLPVIGTGAAYTVTVNATNYYGPWTLVGYSSPLPVELLNFDAHKTGSKVRLEWATASEINNHHFEVERSADGRNFKTIATIAGSGTTTIRHEYSAMDEDPLQGISYYRLRQEDFDGATTHSDIVTIHFKRELSGILYPQPATDLVYWESDDKSLSSELIFSLYTPTGALVQQEKLYPSATGQYPLHLSNLSGSIYFLRISGDGIQQQVPLLINR